MSLCRVNEDFHEWRTSTICYLNIKNESFSFEMKIKVKIKF